LEWDDRRERKTQGESLQDTPDTPIIGKKAKKISNKSIRNVLAFKPEGRLLRKGREVIKWREKEGLEETTEDLTGLEQAQRDFKIA